MSETLGENTSHPLGGRAATFSRSRRYATHSATNHTGYGNARNGGKMSAEDDYIASDDPLAIYYAGFGYKLERWMYGIAFVVGLIAFIFTIIRLVRTTRRDLVIAARLFSFKISLTVADSIVLFIYAPTQFMWLTTFWWYGGDFGCRLFKFLATFGFHLTANMQVLVAADRLFITAKMNRVDINVKRRRYNTRLSLAAAWLIALICALPQMFIFRQGISLEGNPQCVSVWTETRLDYIEKQEHIETYQHFMKLYAANSSRLFYRNMTLKVAIPQKPEYDLQQLNAARSRWAFLEQLYNVLHLATICVIPYMLELVCYTLILYILKSASRGNFMSLQDIFWQKVCFCFRSTNASNCGSANTQETQSLVTIAMHSRTQTTKDKNNFDNDRRRAASLGETTALSTKVTLIDTDSVNYVNDRRKTNDRQRNVVPPKSSRSETAQNYFTQTTLSGNHSPKIHFSKSSNSCDLRASNDPVRRRSEPMDSNVQSAWVSTVDTARRNARWKAFLMLSLNLLFWAPYCILGVVSSVIVFEAIFVFQFVSALVTFNAISNILL